MGADIAVSVYKEADLKKHYDFIATGRATKKLYDS